MTDWAQAGWCDRCEMTLDNGGAGDGLVCPVCGFDSGKAEAERKAAKLAKEQESGSGNR
jgi:hypothetical protein